MTLPKRDSHGRFITKTPVKVLKDKVFASVLTESEYVLVLKAVEHDMRSSWKSSFKYPKKGMVEAPDWKPTNVCGNGLHGFLWGEGICSFALDIPNPTWLVIKVLRNEIISLNNGLKVKFPKGEVVFCGNLKDAAALITSHHEGKDKRTIGAHKVGGHSCHLRGGAKCNLKGGNHSTLIGESDSRLEGGYYSTLIGGADTTFKGEMSSTFISRPGYKDAMVQVDGLTIMPNKRYRWGNGSFVLA